MFSVLSSPVCCRSSAAQETTYVWLLLEGQGQLHGRAFVLDVTLAVTGSFKSLRALSRHPGDPAALRNSGIRVSDLHNAARPLQDTSHVMQQQQQHVHVQQHPAEQAAATASDAPFSWSLPHSSSGGLQVLGSRRRLTQSLWDVVGSLLQQAQLQVQHARSSRQLATDSNSFDQQLWNMPGDPTAGELVLQSAEPLLTWPTSNAAQQRARGSSSANSDSVRSLTHRGTGPAKLELQILFAVVGSSSTSTSLRLPLPPRSFGIVVEAVNEPDSRFNCVNALVYKDQVVTCPGLEFQKAYNVMLVDERESLLLCKCVPS